MTLHLPPPEILTLARIWRAFSRMMTRQSGSASAQAMAPKNPAAPPPTITAVFLWGREFKDYSLDVLIVGLLEENPDSFNNSLNSFELEF